MRLVHHGKSTQTKPQIVQLGSSKSLSEAAFRGSYHLACRWICWGSDLALHSCAQENDWSCTIYQQYRVTTRDTMVDNKLVL